MAYCSVADVRGLLPFIAEADVSDDTVLACIDEADAYIDSALACAYSVPFDPVPTLIMRLSARLAATYVLQTLPDRYVDRDLEREFRFIEQKLALLRVGSLKLSASSVRTRSTVGVYASERKFDKPDWTPDQIA